MNQRDMVAALEIDLQLLIKAVVDNRINAIAKSDRRDSAAIAIAKHLLDLLLSGEVHILTPLCPEFCQPDVARGRQDGEPIALLVPDHDPLHQTVAWEMTGLGRAQGRLSRLVLDEIVTDLAIR